MGKPKQKVASPFHKGSSALKPMNQRQAEYIYAIENSKIICGTGVAGSGKTYIAARLAAEMLLNKTVHKIILSRPNEIEGTRTIGLLPGTLEEKMGPVLAPVVNVLKQELGTAMFELLVKRGTIEYLPLEYIKGHTFDNCFVLIDEAEDITQQLVKVLLLRTGQNCKIVLDGDIAQHAIKEESGLGALVALSKKLELPVAFVDFPSWDDYCVRSEEVKYLGKIFDKYGF
jgi:phosphate starvation-inducible PhoH-like protein